MARRTFQLLLIVGVFVLFLSSCSPYLQGIGPSGPGTDFSNDETNTSTGSVAEPAWGSQTKTSGCHANGPLQDQACTPGDIVQGATREEICTPGYARKMRNVSQSLKNDVYASYGIVKRKP
ncbi:MAG TPA: HNH endonuclease, partial [Ktedonobacteraceae bacterium]